MSLSRELADYASTSQVQVWEKYVYVNAIMIMIIYRQHGIAAGGAEMHENWQEEAQIVSQKMKT